MLNNQFSSLQWKKAVKVTLILTTRTRFGFNNIRSNEAQQPINSDTLVNESSDSHLSDVEVRPNLGDRPGPEDRSSPEPVRGRKRKRNPDKWQRARQRTKRLSGKEYKTRRGCTVAEKIFSDTLCGCTKKCNEKISTNERKNIFQSFYKLNNQNEQNLFFNGCIKSSSVKDVGLLINLNHPEAILFHFFSE